MAQHPSSSDLRAMELTEGLITAGMADDREKMADVLAETVMLGNYMTFLVLCFLAEVPAEFARRDIGPVDGTGFYAPIFLSAQGEQVPPESDPAAAFAGRLVSAALNDDLPLQADLFTALLDEEPQLVARALAMVAMMATSAVKAHPDALAAGFFSKEG